MKKRSPRMWAFRKRNRRQPELTLLPCGSGVFSCPLDVGIPQAEPKTTRQFRLRRSYLSRMVGAGASTKNTLSRLEPSDSFRFAQPRICWTAGRRPSASRTAKFAPVPRAARSPQVGANARAQRKGSQQKSPRRLPRAFCCV